VTAASQPPDGPSATHLQRQSASSLIEAVRAKRVPRSPHSRTAPTHSPRFFRGGSPVARASDSQTLQRDGSCPRELDRRFAKPRPKDRSAYPVHPCNILRLPGKLTSHLPPLLLPAKAVSVVPKNVALSESQAAVLSPRRKVQQHCLQHPVAIFTIRRSSVGSHQTLRIHERKSKAGSCFGPKAST